MSLGRGSLSLAVGWLLLGGCASARNTLAQDLAFERWEKCRDQAQGINLQRITADGQLWVIYTADHRIQLNSWQTCMRQAAAEQGQRRNARVSAPNGASVQGPTL